MIKHILFDLDGTLYSMSKGMDEFFRKRIQEFTASWLGLSWEECMPLWKEALKRYGTTLEWLIAEKGFTDTEAFMAHVHPENEVDFLPDDPELRPFLEALPCPCSILTNAPRFHADRVIKKLNVEGIFKEIFALDDPGAGGKPHPASYQRVLDCYGLSPKQMLFIDDLPKYVEGYIKIGGKALLMDENDVFKDYPLERIRNLKEIIKYLEE